MRCEDLKELLPLRSLDLLDPAEEAAVREHLDGGCPTCAAELAASREVLESLAYLLPEEEPSPMAKARLMAAVKKERAAGQPGGSSLGRIAGAAVAAAIVAGLLMGVVMMRRQDELVVSHQEVLTSLRAEIARQKEQMSALARQVRDARESIQMVSAPGVTVVDLAGQGEQAGAAARVFWDRGRNRWQLYAANLAAPPEGKTYQLWLITADQKISAGIFDPSQAPDAEAAGSVEVPPGAGTVLAAAVTDEPAGGSPQPTGSILLLGKI